ncbi:MAG: hypothetical protein NC541_07455 [bacterium]|nr:hypothetical protein [bacterium]
MNTEQFSAAMSELDSKYVEEALNYGQKREAKNKGRILWGVLAACLAGLIFGCGVIFSHRGTAVRVYARGTDEEITEAGAVLCTGTISDTGEMKGHPLMFYLSGRGIETVRFSCKNQQISFTDWTGKRDEYGNAQNFTVPYGEDESEYYYLTVDWVPNGTIRELTDHAEATASALPAELREDLIVMEITFANGKTAVKAITVSLLEDGTFFASLDSYEISEKDDFLKRADSTPIPREIFSVQGGGPDGSQASGEGESVFGNEDPVSGDETPVPDGEDPVSGNGDPVPGGAVDDMPQPEGNRIPDGAESSRPADRAEERDEEGSAEESAEALSAAEKAAREYYAATVFEVVSVELESRTESEIVFSVCVSKGGEIQEPNRTAFLRLEDGGWKVINEGY